MGHTLGGLALRLAELVPGFSAPLNRVALKFPIQVVDGIPELPGLLAVPADSPAHRAIGRFNDPMVAAKG